MLTTSVSDFRKEIKKYLDSVTDDYETLILNRGNEKSVVVISLDEYNSWIETSYLTSSKTNKKRLDESIEQLKEGGGTKRELIEE